MQVCAAVVETGAVRIERRADVGGGQEIHMVEGLSDGRRAAEGTGDAILFGDRSIRAALPGALRPVIRTRKPPWNGSAAIHASCGALPAATTREYGAEQARSRSSKPPTSGQRGVTATYLFGSSVFICWPIRHVRRSGASRGDLRERKR